MKARLACADACGRHVQEVSYSGKCSELISHSWPKFYFCHREHFDPSTTTRTAEREMPAVRVQHTLGKIRSFGRHFI